MICKTSILRTKFMKHMLRHRHHRPKCWWSIGSSGDYLLMTLTFDLWPWKHLSNGWWMLVASFAEISPISNEISQDEKTGAQWKMTWKYNCFHPPTGGECITIIPLQHRIPASCILHPSGKKAIIGHVAKISTSLTNSKWRETRDNFVCISCGSWFKLVGKGLQLTDKSAASLHMNESIWLLLGHKIQNLF